MMIHILVNMVQLIGVLVPLAGCVLLVKKMQSRTSMYLLLANLGCLIINGSYMLFLQTETYEGALIAWKMEYFGNIVFYLMFGMFLWSYLRLKRHRWTKALLIFWCIQDLVFLLSIWLGDPLQWVFEELQFQWNEGLGLVLIQAQPGVLYMIRYSTMCLILLCGMIYTTVRIFLMQIVSERNNLAKLAGAQFVICASLILMLLFNFSFDIVPIFASLSILSIIISVYRDEFFGITELGQQWVFEQMEDAFVIVDEMYGYMDSNSYARKVFPELNYKRKNETVSGDMYRLFTSTEKIQQIHGKYYNKKIMEIKEKGVISGYNMLLVDITEQYELMERVKQEKERADEANRAKTAFVSNVSHEIRTPMNAIVGITQIMLRKNPPKQEKEYLQNILNSGNALLTIINDLLDMSKIESGKMELVEEEYNFMSMLNDLGMILLNRIGNKPVELLFDIDPNMPAGLYGDALRIRQIIINLMNNATKFTEKGYVCLEVKINQIKQDDIELYFSIKDTGQGIREEDIGKLFGSFQQVDTRKNHHKEGTGLGLSISKQLVELMRGRIGVKSEYGKGSEFYFTIHQRITNGEKAACLSTGMQAVIAGSMKNQAADEMLKKLAGQYQLCYVEDILSDVPPDIRTGNSFDTDSVIPPQRFFFTDRYETLGEKEKQELAAGNVTICGLHNPMMENDYPEDVVTVNKPLYSYTFCNLLENRQIMAEEKKCSPRKETTRDDGGEKTVFTAPDARVLIVDDNEINLMVAEEMLRPLQVQTETAADGQQALAMIREKTYDLIFMDHLMPVMDGIETTVALRKLDGAYYKKVPVIALTGNTAVEQQEAYTQAGMNGHLAKPIDMEELFYMVRKWIPDKVKI